MSRQGRFDVRLKKICEDMAVRQRLFQESASDKLALRLDDLRAAPNMEMARRLPGNWEELKGDRRGQFSCRLGNKLRLIVKPTRQPPPLKSDGGLDWPAVDALTVTVVVNYHV